jgi:hypothetical protein
MSRPKDTAEKLERFANAWRTLAPDKSFGGMTLAQFETACAPSNTKRAAVAELEERLRAAKADRDTADDVTADAMERVVNGVRADPTEGDDSPLYGALGYTRSSERKTGLTRKRKDPSKP